MKLEQVCNDYYMTMLTFARHLTDNVDQAQDIVQETFLRVCRFWSAEYELWHSWQIATWLYTIERNVVHDSRRRLQVRERFLIHQTLEDTVLYAPGELAVDIERREAIKQTLEELTPGHREVLMYVLRGYPSHDLGSCLHLSRCAAGMRLSRARKAFQEHYWG